jgi:hypothetical protein
VTPLEYWSWGHFSTYTCDPQSIFYCKRGVQFSPVENQTINSTVSWRKVTPVEYWLGVKFVRRKMTKGIKFLRRKTTQGVIFLRTKIAKEWNVYVEKLPHVKFLRKKITPGAWAMVTVDVGIQEIQWNSRCNCEVWPSSLTLLLNISIYVHVNLCSMFFWSCITMTMFDNDNSNYNDNINDN